MIDRTKSVWTDYIGIEYHKYNNEQNPEYLHNLLKNSFKGKIFSNQ